MLMVIIKSLDRNFYATLKTSLVISDAQSIQVVEFILRKFQNLPKKSLLKRLLKSFTKKFTKNEFLYMFYEI